MPERKRGKRDPKEPASGDAEVYLDNDSMDRSVNHPRSVQALASIGDFRTRDKAQPRQELDLEEQRDRPEPPRWLYNRTWTLQRYHDMFFRRSPSKHNVDVQADEVTGSLPRQGRQKENPVLDGARGVPGMELSQANIQPMPQQGDGAGAGAESRESEKERWSRRWRMLLESLVKAIDFSKPCWGPCMEHLPALIMEVCYGCV